MKHLSARAQAAYRKLMAGQPVDVAGMTPDEARAVMESAVAECQRKLIKAEALVEQGETELAKARALRDQWAAVLQEVQTAREKVKSVIASLEGG